MARRIATTTTVERDELLDFVRPRHHLVLITQRQDGSPQVSPVTGGVDQDGADRDLDLPRASEGRQRPSHAESACWCSPTTSATPGCMVDGTCEVIDPPDSVEPLVDYFRCISGEHPDWDEYRQAMRDQGKSLLRITPTRWGPIATGGSAAPGRPGLRAPRRRRRPRSGWTVRRWAPDHRAAEPGDRRAGSVPRSGSDRGTHNPHKLLRRNVADTLYMRQRVALTSHPTT